MLRVRPAIALALLSLFAWVVPAPAKFNDDALWTGRWALVTVDSAEQQTIWCIVDLNKQDGAWQAHLVAANPRQANLKVEKLSIQADQVTLEINTPGGVLTFVGQRRGDKSPIRGSFGSERRLQMAFLEATERDSLTTRDVTRSVPVPPAMRRALELSAQPMRLQVQANRETDPAKKAELARQASEASQKVWSEVPALYREVVDKHADEPAAGFAAQNLLASAVRDKASLEDVNKWVAVVRRHGQPYGRRWLTEQLLRLAEMLRAGPDYVSVVYDLAQTLDRDMTAGANVSLEQQSRVLQLLHAAEAKLGKPSASATKARWDSVEKKLDEDYLAKVPPFKPMPYAERKASGNRVVVMELFTGAQCPPCVAADVAFDALLKTYQPKDVIFLQYHLHIPGPDPLTNADSEARFRYYRQKYENELRGTPSTVFNGKPAAGGGGGMANAKQKYDQYCRIISPLLEQEAPARLELTAVRQGEQVRLAAKVAGPKEPLSSLRIRFVLVEENIRYVGGNGLRFHHHVVRSFPGGVAGLPIPPDGQTVAVTEDLAELRAKLASYLDDFARRRPFPKGDRPLELTHLRAVALLQDDETLEILAAMQVDLPVGTASK